MNEQKNFTRREKQELRKQERSDINSELHKKREMKKKIKIFSIILLVLIALVYAIYYQSKLVSQERFINGNVHWHAKIRIEVCGEYRSIENIGSETNHIGNDLLHTHGDNLYHLEGAPVYKSQTTLGAYFNAIDILVNDNGVFEYRNGQTCPNGTIGFVKMMVNNLSVSNISNYVPKDNDTISIKFG